MCAGRQQNAQIAVGSRPQDTPAVRTAIGNEPALFHGSPGQGGERLGLHLGGFGRAAVELPADAVHAAPAVRVERVPARRKGHIGWLHPALGLHVSVEVVVDPLQHRPHRAEVLDQALLGVAEPLEQVVVDRDVRAAEAVDALLRIAHNEELPVYQGRVSPVRREGLPVPLVGCQIEGDLRLERIGVLELVHEDALEARLRAPSNVGMVAQQVARPGQQILEGGHTVGLTLAHPLEHEVAQDRQHPGEGCGAMRLEGLGDGLIRLAQHVLDGRARVAPVGQLVPTRGIAPPAVQLAKCEQSSQRILVALRLCQSSGPAG